jgi:LacI family transcriptional regulator
VNYCDLQGPIGIALEQAHDKVVLIGNYTENSQIHCVLADDERAVRIAMQHLLDNGHRKIACICGHPENQIESIQVSTWRDCLSAHTSAQEIEAQLIAVQPPPMSDATELSYDVVCDYIRQEHETGAEPTSAFITTASEIAVGTLAACQDMRAPVPQAISLVHLQDSPRMKFARPPVSCIDIDFDSQISTAFEILDASIAGRPSPFEERVIRVQPRLIERGTVLKATVTV